MRKILCCHLPLVSGCSDCFAELNAQLEAQTEYNRDRNRDIRLLSDDNKRLEKLVARLEKAIEGSYYAAWNNERDRTEELTVEVESLRAEVGDLKSRARRRDPLEIGA